MLFTVWTLCIPLLTNHLYTYRTLRIPQLPNPSTHCTIWTTENDLHIPFNKNMLCHYVLKFKWQYESLERNFGISGKFTPPHFALKKLIYKIITCDSRALKWTRLSFLSNWTVPKWSSSRLSALEKYIGKNEFFPFQIYQIKSHFVINQRILSCNILRFKTR